MGLADRLGEKTKGLGQGGAKGTATDATPRAPRTGPGQLLAVRSMMADNNAEVDRLREQLEAYAGSRPALELDSKLVVFSKYANRHEDEFTSADFVSLREQIKSAGRNIQPILVRRLAGDAGRYEVMFGHRRLRACQDLGLNVFAVVGEADDEALFLYMDMENRSRKNPSPFELGDSYRRALESGLFSSLRQLATKIHMDHSQVAKAYGIATLPPEVLGAFPSPTMIQYRWGQLISDALQRDPEGVSKRARKLQADREGRNAAQVLAVLVNEGKGSVAGKRSLPGSTGKAPLGSLTVDRKGGLRLDVRPGIVPADRVADLESLVLGFIRQFEEKKPS